MVFCQKKQKQCLPGELGVGDCLIGLSLAKDSGLILSVRVGKHTDALLDELVVSTEEKTDSNLWYTDNWGGYERQGNRMKINQPLVLSDTDNNAFAQKSNRMLPSY